MAESSYPLLYQVNTRVWLTDLSQRLGRKATLDDIPDAELERLREKGFDWVWLLSVWQTGSAGQKASRENPEWRKEFQDTLPDLIEDDIAGSGFAITDYGVHKDLGGREALSRVRERMRRLGLKLLLDFVPNHTALDHLWVESHPEFYIEGTESDMSAAPQNYIKIRRKSGDLVLAHGRDPYFPGWPDTLQLNYANPATQEAMLGELIRIAEQCDGVRCDMAMLLLPDVFERTWGNRSRPFWAEAIRQVRAKYSEFMFMAEVYWDLEWTLQQQGFDYTYDKRLYDRLRGGNARAVREHLSAPLDYQRKMARFLENHDEPRAAFAFSSDVHEAAAAVTFLTPGLRLFHQGQFEGRRKRISPHLVRGPSEQIDLKLENFYDRLLTLLRRTIFHHGQWQLVECVPAWDGNWTSDCFICFAWQDDKERMLITVNYAPNRSQCYLRLPFENLAGSNWRLEDQIGDAVYERDGDELVSGGLFLDVPAWQVHIFSRARLSNEVSLGNQCAQSSVR
jgi:glycosidase